MSATPTVEQHFESRPAQLRIIYDRILSAARRLGPVREDPKKTSIHLVRKSAFAGVATRKDALVLTLKSTEDLASPRVIKREQTSARRWHLEIRLENPKDVDRELKAWLATSYELSA